MVRRRLPLFVILLVPLSARAITPQELEQLQAQAESAQRARAQRFVPGRFGGLLPRAGVPAGGSTNAATPPRRAVAVSVPASPDTYVPPADLAASSANVIENDAVSINPKHPFGLPLGTWIRGELTRAVTNASPGYAEITVTADVAGTRATLPAGSRLFAQASYNPATNRLDLTTVKGVTPNGRPFDLRGLVFDAHKSVGLAGIVSENPQRVVRTGIDRGLLAGAGAAVQQFAGSSIAGAAAGSAASSMVGAEGNAVDQKAADRVTIYVSPQPVLVQIQPTD